MSKATICGSAGNALEQVVDPSTTVRCVRKPTLQPCCLKVRAAEESTLVVEIDGEKVATHTLYPGTNHIPLSNLVPPPSRFISLFTGGRSSKPAEPAEFTIFVRRGKEQGTLLSTYTFKLMSEDAFDQAFDNYVRNNEAKAEPASFTTDECAVDSVISCWNCRKPIEANTCCAECGCEQKNEEEPEQEPEAPK